MSVQHINEFTLVPVVQGLTLNRLNSIFQKVDVENQIKRKFADFCPT